MSFYELLPRVFLIFVRPYYEDRNDPTKKVFIQTGILYSGEYGTPVSLKTIITGNSKYPVTSPVKINSTQRYQADVWYLYGSFTSYNEAREEMKKLIAVYGTANVRLCVDVPIDYEVLPNK